MLKRLRLSGFKSFADAELNIGPLTVLVGANATGKSNIRDAFRFIHGISRGYSLAEIIGEKWGEGGQIQWHGIRGGTRETLFPNRSTFRIEVEFELYYNFIFNSKRQNIPNGRVSYIIDVDPGFNAMPPKVSDEFLEVSGIEGMKYSTFDLKRDHHHLTAEIQVRGKKGRPAHLLIPRHSPLLIQIADHPKLPRKDQALLRGVAGLLRSRFLDLNPNQMRKPSLPGLTVLGDEGENLSSVLQAICEDDARRQSLISWIRELTPMDATDLEFPADQTGKVLVTLVEENGQRISAHSASDGTLRFLAMIATLLSPEPARLYFFEELDNGIHPSRLHLLLQLIEQRTRDGSLQVVATTHSPHLLALLSPAARKHASLTYRLPGSLETRIKRIVDIPGAERVIKEQDLAHLHASGWLEDAVFFTEDDDEAGA